MCIFGLAKPYTGPYISSQKPYLQYGFFVFLLYKVYTEDHVLEISRANLHVYMWNMEYECHIIDISNMKIIVREVYIFKKEDYL